MNLSKPLFKLIITFFAAIIVIFIVETSIGEQNSTELNEVDVVQASEVLTPDTIFTAVHPHLSSVVFKRKAESISLLCTEEFVENAAFTCDSNYGWLDDIEFSINMSGRVSAGIDLERYTIDINIDSINNNIQLIVPHAQILAILPIYSSAINYELKTSSIFMNDDELHRRLSNIVDTAFEEMIEDFEQDALNENILQSAEENFEIYITNFCREFYPNIEVSIEFTNDIASNSSLNQESTINESRSTKFE